MKTIGNTKEQFLVKLQPVGRRIQISKDESILEAARLAGVDITSICGGVGVCDSCRVKLIQGKLSPPTLEEQDTFTQQEFNDFDSHVRLILSPMLSLISHQNP